VELLKDDQLVDANEILPDTNGAARVTFRVKAPESGEQRYVFRVPPQPEEADVANNERPFFSGRSGQGAGVAGGRATALGDEVSGSIPQTRSACGLTAVYRLNAQRNLAVVSATGAETRMERICSRELKRK